MLNEQLEIDFQQTAEQPAKKKKVAIISFRHKIKLDQRSNVSLDHIFLEKYLTHFLGYDTYFVSPINKGDKNLPVNYINSSSVNINDFDELFVYATNSNFVAGCVPNFSSESVRQVIDFNGPINVVIIDKLMPLYNYAKIFEDRPYLKFADPKFKLLPDDAVKFANKDYRVWYTGKDYNYYINEFKMNGLRYYLRLENFAETIFPSIFIFMNKDIPLEKKEKKYDIAYYGIPRGSARQKKLVHYFNGEEKLTKLVIGFQKDYFKNATFLKWMTLRELYSKVQECKASLVIGDPKTDQYITHRFFESVKCGVLSFIDVEYDPDREFYKDEYLASLMYVSCIEDIYKVFDLCAQDETLYQKIVDLQFKELDKWSSYIIKDSNENFKF